MKILYLSPENTVGTAGLWQRIHQQRGNQCRVITFFPSDLGFTDDICLNLPLTGTARWFRSLRNTIYKRTKGPLGEVTDLPGNPPVWQPGSGLERAFFAFRDRLWRFWVEPAIRRYGLLDFDVYHFEWGLDFYRQGGFIKRLAERNKPLLATYHGQDLRHRGVIPAVHKHIWLNMSSEHDLLARCEGMRYLFLPYDVAAIEPQGRLHDPITICHATRSYYAKGSDSIIAACRALERSHGIRFILIENQSHAVTMQLKSQSDIYIDQVSNVGPGYGMNSIEAMSLGLACCTYLDSDYLAFLPDHPFVNVSPDNLLQRLTDLVEHPDQIIERGRNCRGWVEARHGLGSVGDQLYGYYRELGII